MELNQTVDIGTDIASFFIFHPDDLAHRRSDPIEWHSYGFACRKEFEAGNLVAFRTTSDGGFQLRFTSGDLTEAEQDLENGSWEWGYTVRHGNVFVDNGDYLPSNDADEIEHAPHEQWVTIPNGDYRVIVHPIERKDNSLPDYVVRFLPVPAPLHLAVSPAPPILAPWRTEPPFANEGMPADNVSVVRAEIKPLAETYPLLVAEGQFVLPGGSLSLVVPDDLFAAVSGGDKSLRQENGDIYVVFAPTNTVPGFGTLCWVNGSSQFTGEPGRLSLQGKRLVRVTAQTEARLLPTAHVEPVTRPQAALGEAEFKALQAAFDRYAEAHPNGENKIPSFERERAGAMTSGTALTTLLLDLVPLPVETSFRLYGASDTDRAKELIAVLDANG